MTPKEVYRRYFKNRGYTSSYNKKIIEYIDYKVDIFMKDDETIAVYLVEKENLLSSLFDVSKMVKISKPEIKVCLIILGDFHLLGEDHIKALESDTDLYIIKNENMIPIIKSAEKKIIDNLKMSEIEKTFQNVNRICNTKWGCKIFKLKKNLFNKLDAEIKNEKDFIYQITTISSLLESIDSRSLKGFLNPTSKKEKELFEKGQSISIIESFLKKVNRTFDSSLILTMREIRELRNIPPVHPSSKGTRICRRYIKKIPQTDDGWIELHNITLNKFIGCLTLLRDTIK